MAAVVPTVGIVLTLLYFINGQILKSTVFSPSELIQDSNLVNNSLKLALRYGFQRTSECRDFSKAYICVQKCLDLGFDVAYSNKHCFCTCYHKKGKVKVTPLSIVTKTKWRLGAPTTKLPPWATTKKSDEKLQDNTTVDIQYVLLNATISDITGDVPGENTTHETETYPTGDTANNTDVTGAIVTHQEADNATNVTSTKEDVTPQTGGTGTPKDDHVTGTGNTDKGTHDPNNASNGTNVTGVTSHNTGGTGATGATGAHSETKANGAVTGGTEKPKEGTGATTSAP